MCDMASLIALPKCGDETQVTAGFVILRFVTFTFVWAGLSTEKKQECCFRSLGLILAVFDRLSDRSIYELHECDMQHSLDLKDKVLEGNFQARFGGAPKLYRAPGRVNLIGE